ncbi:5'-methylthioadenosine/adenosylhomocysteine nucleosidase [Lactobacillus sp. DCY120]|uniref:adenosylhomocysteine nucleosidase n=1 Tax=Bombilactobacillus apium TaxID=2675299 RepID=A0A850R524_9LACO|nr:5'-methylthioadenosine/adenosylhomocysteine nucleosidase [Bombilactobacillus apium]NVY95692.1 5'-methylthioadenosine/adenosylhomocysteine nucleosidase [Bombilactobacillus apium]
MKIGVIVAMAEEMGLLEESLLETQTTEIAGIKFISGHYHNHELVMAQSGIGKVQAALVTTLLCDQFTPDLIINTGSAGGIGSGLRIGDLVVARKVAYHDVDVTASGYKPGQLPQQPRYFDSDLQVVKQIMHASQAIKQPAHTGLIVSGDQFIADRQEIAAILVNFPEALAAEMEGAAVGQVASQFQIPFVVIRAMSDVGDENAAVSFDQFVVEAGRRSVQMLLNFMDQN